MELYKTIEIDEVYKKSNLETFRILFKRMLT